MGEKKISASKNREGTWPVQDSRKDANRRHDMESSARLMSHDLHLSQGMDVRLKKGAKNKVLLIPHY